MKEIWGQIAIAEISDLIEHPFYRYRGVIKTGPLEGKETLIAYSRKKPPELRQIIMRSDRPPIRWSRITNYDKIISGNFITTDIPGGFEYSDSRQTLFMARWRRDIQMNYFPSFSDIGLLYEIGKLKSVLLCRVEYLEGEKDKYFYLFEKNRIERYDNESGIPRGFKASLKRFIERFDRNPNNLYPRLILSENTYLIDKKAPPLIEEAGKDYLRLEPKQ